jgi:hypothetical protein
MFVEQTEIITLRKKIEELKLQNQRLEQQIKNKKFNQNQSIVPKQNFKTPEIQFEELQKEYNRLEDQCCINNLYLFSEQRELKVKTNTYAYLNQKNQGILNQLSNVRQKSKSLNNLILDILHKNPVSQKDLYLLSMIDQAFQILNS